MIFEERTILLKDGRQAFLKTAEPSDAAVMLEYITAACGETEFLARYPEEWENVPVSKEENWIRGGRESPDILPIACFVDGRIVGQCEIRFLTGKKTAHRAGIAIAVRKEYWGLGIGTAMLSALLAAAEARGTEIVELEFIEGNDRAKRLYEKIGFRTVSVRPDVFRLRDGSYRSEYYMQKRLGVF